MWSGFRASLLAATACICAGCVSGPAGYGTWFSQAMLEELETQQEYADFIAARYAGMSGDPSAAAAYYRLVQQRVSELKETRVSGYPTIKGFMERRLAPALNTCAAISSRQEDLSARIARNTQLYLQKEIGITQVVDPLGGSCYLESLTSELADKAWQLIEEVESLGGMTKAIESGIPKRCGTAC